MRWVIRQSLRFRFLVIAAAAALMIFGAGQLKNARTEAFPEFAPPRVEVQTITTGLSAEETEEFVTVPLEQALDGVPNLDIIRSTTVPQLSSIEMLFKKGTDLIQARQVVQERLGGVVPTLPTWAAPPVIRPPLSAVARVMQIGVTADDMSLQQLSTIAYWKIRARLLRVPGVVNVAIWGERLQQVHVNVDPPRLRARNITLDQVPIGRVNGHAVRVGDVADVKYGPQPLIGDAVVGSGPGLLLVLEKSPNANTLKVTKGVDEAIKDLKPGLPGISFDAHVFRQANFIEQAVDNLELSLLLGVILVVMVLVAFLFEWRTALISLVAIPLSLMASILVLILRGETINTMILAGLVIAVGVVVDDAIIDVENIWRRLRQRGDSTGRQAPRIILAAALEVRSAIWYATLINVLAVVPVLFLESVTGSFFQPLAISYALAILVSMLVALTVTPALSLLLLSKTGERGDAPLVRVLKRAYRAVLAPVIRRPWPAIGLALLLALAGPPRLSRPREGPLPPLQ